MDRPISKKRQRWGDRDPKQQQQQQQRHPSNSRHEHHGSNHQHHHDRNARDTGGWGQPRPFVKHEGWGQSRTSNEQDDRREQQHHQHHHHHHYHHKSMRDQGWGRSTARKRPFPQQDDPSSLGTDTSSTITQQQSKNEDTQPPTIHRKNHNTNNEIQYGPIPMEDFTKLTLQQKMNLFLPLEATFQHDDEGVFAQIYPLHYPDNFAARIQNAVNKTIQFAQDEWSQREDERVQRALDSQQELSMWEREYANEDLPSKRPFSDIDRKFIQALPHCVPLYFGLLADDEQKGLCWCPLSDKLKKTWQKQFGVEDEDDFPVCKTANSRNCMLDNALVDHLAKQSARCFHHHICHVFLQELFRDCWGKGIHHKALCAVGTPQYRTAQNKKKQLMHGELRLRQKQIFELEKRNEQLQKENEALKQVNPTKASRLEAFQVLMNKFGIEDVASRSLPTKKQLAVQRRIFDMWFDDIRNKFEFSKKKDKIRIEIPEESKSLCEVLNHLKEAKSPLFDKSNKQSHLWLFDWDVQFKSAVIDDSQHTTKKERKMLKKSKAKDKGGPSRQLLSFVWEKLVDYDINGFHLFEFSSGELWPITNDLMESRGITSQAKSFSRALGRILLHAITNRIHLDDGCERFTIANHVLPPPLRLYLFQRISPLDDAYDPKSLLWDVTRKIFADYDKTEVETEKEKKRSDRLCAHFEYFLDDSLDGDVNFSTDHLRKAAFQNLIKDRSIILDGILEGLGFQKRVEEEKTSTAEGHRFLDVFESGCDIHVIDQLFFAESAVCVEKLIESMKLVSYDTSVEDVHYQFQLFSIDNNKSPSGILVDVIRKLARNDSSFPAGFLEFVTGNRFLPQDIESNQICVEFNKAEMKTEEACVESHACNRVIKFPGSAYKGNAQVVEEKLLMSLEYSGKTFGMT